MKNNNANDSDLCAGGGLARKALCQSSDADNINSNNMTMQQDQQQQQPHSPTIALRGRLDTEDTAPIRNYRPSTTTTSPSKISEALVDDEVQREEDDYDGDTTMEDSSSIISSLSNDDSRIVMNAVNATTKTTAATTSTIVMPVLPEHNHDREEHHLGMPPMEVSIPSPRNSAGQQFPWRRMSSNLSSCSSQNNTNTAAATAEADPFLARPTLGRHQSAPVYTANTSMDYSSNASTTQESITTSTSISTMESLIQELSLKNEHVTQTARLLGERRRRIHTRARSAATISVGSMVGQSSLTVATSTSIASSSCYSGSESSMAILSADGSSRNKKKAAKARQRLSELTGIDDEQCCVASIEAKFRKRNVVKDEIKHVLKSVVTTPLKVVRKKENPDLKRSSGCLT